MKKENITGQLNMPKQWTVFAPFEASTETPADLKSIPKEITMDGKTLAAEQVTPERYQFDYSKRCGATPFEKPLQAYVYAELTSEKDQDVTLGLGADWVMEVWLNGEEVFETRLNGNMVGPPSINDHHVQVSLKKGVSVLCVRVTNGRNGASLSLGGPDDLRDNDFICVQEAKHEMDAAELFAKYPADPEACIKWHPPASFDPREKDLGLPELAEAEHFDLLKSKPSSAALEDGGDGSYESCEHGTWNHNVGIATFKDRLIGIWGNHSKDENGPGARIMGCVGKVTDEEGRLKWNKPIVLAPEAVPVNRRNVTYGEVIQPTVNGGFYTIGGRLIWCGKMLAVHGLVTGSWDHLGGYYGKKRQIPSGHYFLKPSAKCTNGHFAFIDLDCNFYQEWDVVDDELVPVSPLYLENEIPVDIQISPDMFLSIKPLLDPYKSAPLLNTAPADLQDLINKGERIGNVMPKYRKGEGNLAADGTKSLLHHAHFKRADGSWLVIREKKYPKIEPFQYVAEKPDDDSYYPLGRRTNLYGAVKSTCGSLPDGSDYIVCNTPNRSTMYMTVSKDGRNYDKTWFLRQERLDYTPGAMKREGSAAGPQYFVSAVVGNSIWIVYSIAKENIAATRVPISALK